MNHQIFELIFQLKIEKSMLIYIEMIKMQEHSLAYRIAVLFHLILRLSKTTCVSVCAYFLIWNKWLSFCEQKVGTHMELIIVCVPGCVPTFFLYKHPLIYMFYVGLFMYVFSTFRRNFCIYFLVSCIILLKEG